MALQPHCRSTTRTRATYDVSNHMNMGRSNRGQHFTRGWLDLIYPEKNVKYLKKTYNLILTYMRVLPKHRYIYYKFTKKMSYAAWITLRMDDKTDSVHEDMKLQKKYNV